MKKFNDDADDRNSNGRAFVLTSKTFYFFFICIGVIWLLLRSLRDGFSSVFSIKTITSENHTVQYIYFLYLCVRVVPLCLTITL